MIYGFMDESGAPGVATSENDFLVVSLILFDDATNMKVAAGEVRKLRKKLELKDAYEFHCSHNTKRIQRAVLRLIVELKFCFVTVAIRKTRVKKHASYAAIAKMLVCEIEKVCSEIRVEMDSNPVLSKALKIALRESSVRYCRVREVESCRSDLVQMADYIVNMSAKEVAGCDAGIFKKICSKRISLIIKN